MRPSAKALDDLCTALRTAAARLEAMGEQPCAGPHGASDVGRVLVDVGESLRDAGEAYGHDESDALRAGLLSLHVAEYQTLTTRATYWIALQYQVWPLLVLFLTLVPSIYEHFGKQTAVWGTLVVVQLVVHAYNFALYEIYNLVRYVERDLKRRVGAAVKKDVDQFWGYERYLSRRRAVNSIWGDASPVVFSLVALGAACFVRGPTSGWDSWDWAGLCLNVCGWLATVAVVARMVRTRREFFSDVVEGT